MYLCSHKGEKKYNSEVYEQFIDLFTRLPLCALIDNKYFAVHGGISPFVKTIGTYSLMQLRQKRSIVLVKSLSTEPCVTSYGAILPRRALKDGFQIK